MESDPENSKQQRSLAGSDRVSVISDLLPERPRWKPDAEPINAHAEQFGGKKVAKFVNEHQDPDDDEEVEECWQEVHA